MIRARPSACPEDIAGPGGSGPDGEVNVSDLIAVINAWGPCIGVFPCIADINADGSVNVTDLLAVINGWGACDSVSGGAPETVEDCESDCAQQYPGGGADYANCVSDCVRALCAAEKLPPEDCP